MFTVTVQWPILTPWIKKLWWWGWGGQREEKTNKPYTLWRPSHMCCHYIPHNMYCISIASPLSLSLSLSLLLLLSYYIDDLALLSLLALILQSHRFPTPLNMPSSCLRCLWPVITYTIFGCLLLGGWLLGSLYIRPSFLFYTAAAAVSDSALCNNNSSSNNNHKAYGLYACTYIYTI